MNVIKYTLFLAADLILVGCIAHLVYVCLHKQTECDGVGFRNYTRDPDGKRPSRFKAFQDGALIVGAFISVGIFIYGGVSFLLSWMPDRWGAYSDGDYYPARVAISTFCGFWGSIFLLDRLITTAKEFHDLDIEKDCLRHTLNHLTKQLANISRSIDWISRGHPTMLLGDLGDVLTKLEKESHELGNGVRVREQFEDMPREEIIRRRLFYRVDVEPSLRLIKTIRRAVGLPDNSAVVGPQPASSNPAGLDQVIRDIIRGKE